MTRLGLVSAVVLAITTGTLASAQSLRIPTEVQPTGPAALAMLHLASDGTEENAQTGQRGTGGFFRNRPIPFSNPVITQPEVLRPPAGYVYVWKDGRLNPHRGLPKVDAARN